MLFSGWALPMTLENTIPVVVLERGRNHQKGLFERINDSQVKTSPSIISWAVFSETHVVSRPAPPDRFAGQIAPYNQALPWS